MTILNIGCGDRPTETIKDIPKYPKEDIINLDLYRYSNETGNFQRLPYKRIKTLCDIIATGEQLPFRNNIFNKVVSYQVIEHTTKPQRFLYESIRVCKIRHKIIIECPHRKGQASKMRYHRSYLDEHFFITNCYLVIILNGGDMSYSISKIPYFPFAIQSKNRFIRYIVNHYWPIKRLDNLRIEIIK